MSRQLTEKEERLLMRHLDGECGVLDRRKAEKLIGTNQAAEDFVAVMKQVREDSSHQARAREGAPVDLWAGIAQRIESEKRAEIFLGKRSTLETGAWLSGLREWISVPWAVNLSGAAAACVILMLAFSWRDSSEQMVRMSPSAARETSGIHGRPQIIEDRAPNVFDVDWMRSDGRVNIINNHDERSAIIWVQRRGHGLLGKSRRAPEIALLDDATPFAAPDARSVIEQGK